MPMDLSSFTYEELIDALRTIVMNIAGDIPEKSLHADMLLANIDEIFKEIGLRVPHLKGESE